MKLFGPTVPVRGQRYLHHPTFTVLHDPQSYTCHPHTSLCIARQKFLAHHWTSPSSVHNPFKPDTPLAEFQTLGAHFRATKCFRGGGHRSGPRHRSDEPAASVCRTRPTSRSPRHPLTARTAPLAVLTYPHASPPTRTLLHASTDLYRHLPRNAFLAHPKCHTPLAFRKRN